VDNFSGERLSWVWRQDVVLVHLHHAPCNEIGEQTVRELALVADLLWSPGAPRALVWSSDQTSGFSAGDDLLEVRERLRSGDSWELKRWRRVSRRLQAWGMGDFADRVDRRLQRPAFDRFLRKLHEVFQRLDQAPVPTIAAVHGVCFGGGWELALTADIIVADRTARFALPELRLGTIPAFGAIPRLERDAGGAFIRDLLITGRSVRAKRLHELGLVSQVVPPGRAIEIALELAQHATQQDRDTVRMAKQFFKRSVGPRLQSERRLVLEMATRPVFRRALDSFAARQGVDIAPYLAKKID
jgi:enoyl-CoA hydratase/carnithine racemase